MQSLQTSERQTHLWSANQSAVQEMELFQHATITRYTVPLLTLAFGQLSSRCKVAGSCTSCGDGSTRNVCLSKQPESSIDNNKSCEVIETVGGIVAGDVKRIRIGLSYS